MKKVRLALIIAFTLFFSQGLIFPETVTNVDGKWELTIKSPRGEKKRIFELSQDGVKLIVKWQSSNGNIKETSGTITGDQIEWSITRNQGKEKNRLIYKGIVKGDTMTGELIAGKRKPRTWQAQRVPLIKP